MTPSRRLSGYLIATFLVIAAGLLTLPVRHILPEPVISSLGDALWALCVYLLLTIVRPKWSAQRIFLTALIFAWCIEFSQIYHAPWIDVIRLTLPGRLILGRQFDWQDLIWYLCGCLIGCWLDSLLGKSGKIQPLTSGETSSNFFER